MKPEGHKSDMPWLAWVYDPCPEGGWHIVEGFETQDEAVAFARAKHEEELQKFAQKKEAFQKRGVQVLFHCYSGVMVTPGQVFSLELEDK